MNVSFPHRSSLFNHQMQKPILGISDHDIAVFIETSTGLKAVHQKKYKNYNRKFNVKNIGIYRNYFGKYRINIGIFTAFSAKKDVNKEFTNVG